MTTLARRMRRRLGVGLLAGILAVALIPVPTVHAAGSKPYTLDLGTRGDFVAQTNFVQCVGASVQMMLNMIEPGRDRTAKTQLRLQRLARAWSGPTPSGFERQGAGVSGWAAALDHRGRRPLSARRDADAPGRAPRRGPRDARDRASGRPADVARPACLGDERVPGDGRPGPDG